MTSSAHNITQSFNASNFYVSKKKKEKTEFVLNYKKLKIT